MKILIFILYFSVTCIGALRSDLNGDGRVNGLDLAILSSEWLQTDMTNKVAQFDGISGLVTVPDDATTRIGLGTWSLTGRAYSAASTRTLLAKQYDDYVTGYQVAFDTAGGNHLVLNLTASDGDNRQYRQTIKDLAVTTEFYWAFVWDGNEMSLYINGEKKALTLEASDGDWPDTDSDGLLRIGNDRAATTPFNGYQDDIRIYKAVLTSDEVSSLNRGIEISKTPSWRMGFEVVSGNIIQGIKADGFELNGTKNSGVTIVDRDPVVQNTVAMSIVDEVVDSLNNGTYNLDFTAVKTLFPIYAIKDLETLRVTVVPKSLNLSAATRAQGEFNYDIDIAIQKALSSVNDAEIQYLMDLIISIAKNFRGKVYTDLGAVCYKQTVDPLYSVEHISPPSVFTSVVTLSFKVIE